MQLVQEHKELQVLKVFRGQLDQLDLQVQRELVLRVQLVLRVLQVLLVLRVHKELKVILV